MDGDEAPLQDIAALCAEYRAALVVDEDHAIGVVGDEGRGLCHELGIVPDVVVGTCSKGLGAQGGFIAGDSAVVEAVVNHGRSFIYSTAPVPAAMGAAVAGLDLLRKEPELPRRLQERSRWLRRQLQKDGWEVPDGRSAIIPLIVGGEEEALALAQALSAAGHHCPAIRPPTVPAGACRLRITPTLAHTESDCRRLITALASCRGS
jgi:8-amino-7-oxononanoate synthase